MNDLKWLLLGEEETTPQVDPNDVEEELDEDEADDEDKDEDESDED